MNHSTLALGLTLLAIAGCSKDASGDAASTASATATGAASASAKSAKKKTVTIKRTQDECTFEFEAPEELKETAKDGMSFTLETESFSFIGFAGAALYTEPKHALDMFKDEYDTVHAGKDGGVLLKVVKSKKPNPSATPNGQIAGMGGEPFTSERPSGCAFNCGGVEAREAEAVAMCKSVKITVAKEAPKKDE